MAWVIDTKTGVAYGDEATAVEIRGDQVVVNDRVLSLGEAIIIPNHNDVRFIDNDIDQPKSNRTFRPRRAARASA